jgi:hypothetical protein
MRGPRDAIVVYMSARRSISVFMISHLLVVFSSFPHLFFVSVYLLAVSVYFLLYRFIF